MQRIGKALPAGGIWGHALPDKFQNSVVAEICVFMHSEAADNFCHLPKKTPFLDNLISSQSTVLSAMHHGMILVFNTKQTRGFHAACDKVEI